MTFEEIQREVKTEIKDANPNILLSIPDYINEALSWVASEYTLPSLKKFNTVTTKCFFKVRNNAIVRTS